VIDVRSVLITGASRGIGRATALRLAQAGWEVHAGVRRPEDGAELAAAGADRIVPIPLDVTDGAQIAALADRLPARLDAVVNNAGIVVDGPLEAVAPERLRLQLETNVVGQMAVTQAVLGRIRASRGRIVFVSSVSGRISAPMMGAYNASKFALEGLADALRVELAPWGVRVIVVQPTSTDTALWRDALQTVEQTESALSDEHRNLYAKHLDGARRLTRMIQKRTMPVEDVAGTIERALTDERPRARYPVGGATKAQLALFAVAPTRAKDMMLARASGIPRRLGG
jgi:NAD(P)-dependent dehydrogenase (short-subunit alcohol dehydrogenase family)